MDGVLLRASASSDGTLSSWEQAAPALPAAGLARLAVDGDLLYLLGQDGRFAVGRIGGHGTVARWEVDPAEAVPPPDLADPQGTPAFAELALGAGHVYVERRGTAAAFVVGTLDPATGHLRALR